ncbi:hypothetical protein [Skermania piniformis]|uniref:Uncharacterized protein n=1 Tax=Skermania pinensis TaxID=39122 RepID=A0ABX8S820_9ACTN|nr:hypothetical protein [Skermania piniformis]QXQ13964.1 hypothetical protein KV203_00360 [Skermania piniformis]
MFYLFVQTWIWLLVAFLLGVATGLFTARTLTQRQLAAASATGPGGSGSDGPTPVPTADRDGER